MLGGSLQVVAGTDQISVAGDVLQPVERDAASFGLPIAQIVLLAGGGVGAERLDQVVIARNVGQRLEGSWRGRNDIVDGKPTGQEQVARLSSWLARRATSQPSWLPGSASCSLQTLPAKRWNARPSAAPGRGTSRLRHDELPAGFDLIVCSEVLYYIGDGADLRRFARRLAAALTPGGHLLVTHAKAVVDDPAQERL